MFEAYCQQLLGALQFENIALKAQLHEARQKWQEAEEQIKVIEAKIALLEKTADQGQS